MSGRVNPITFLARRLSKTLSKSGNSDADNSSNTASRDADPDNIGYRPPRRLPSAHVSRPKERSGLIKRRWSRGSGGRATREKVPSTCPVRSASACPAPLAQSDCFDLTDVSDFEPEVKTTAMTSQAYNTTVDKVQSEKAREADRESFIESEADRMSTSSSRGDSSDEESMISIKENVDPGLHQTEVSAVYADYDFDYPAVKRSESDEAMELEVDRTLPPTEDSSSEESTRRECEVEYQSSTDADEISLSKESDFKRTATDLTDTQSVVYEYGPMDVHAKEPTRLPVENREPDVENISMPEDAKVPIINVQTEDWTQSDGGEAVTYDQQAEWVQDTDYELEQGGSEYDIQEEEVTFEVEHDAAQDPFHEAVLNASRAQYLRDPPAIMVTSPSNHDLTPHSPKRPPPPVVHPPPPPPSEADRTATPPPRPPAPPSVSSAMKSSPNCTEGSTLSEAKPPHSPKKKKHKIFGVSVAITPHPKTKRLRVLGSLLVFAATVLHETFNSAPTHSRPSPINTATNGRIMPRVNFTNRRQASSTCFGRDINSPTTHRPVGAVVAQIDRLLLLPPPPAQPPHGRTRECMCYALRRALPQICSSLKAAANQRAAGQRSETASRGSPASRLAYSARGRCFSAG
ncbi:unnamed protein product [Schistocephalus solidus]|uniref:Chitin-binding type-2 domain-containing protein n=1 Tax=Schistocephalus solidus TaxID=70667 RepID=A0A183T4K6_SCHSO|nr:unnamed protein product [Schistocephalus solidus]